MLGGPTRPGKAGLAAASRCSRARNHAYATTRPQPVRRIMGGTVAARTDPGQAPCHRAEGAWPVVVAVSRWLLPDREHQAAQEGRYRALRLGRPWKLHLPLFGPDLNLGTVAPKDTCTAPGPEAPANAPVLRLPTTVSLMSVPDRSGRSWG